MRYRAKSRGARHEIYASYPATTSRTSPTAGFILTIAMTKNRKHWSQQDIELLTKLYPDTPTKGLAEQLNRTERQVFAKAGDLGLRKSNRSESKAYTCLPVGTIRNRSNRRNEWIIKVSDDSTRSKNWRPYAEYVWMLAGNEPPKKNEIIVFKDGFTAKSPDDYKVEALEKITRSENMRRNSIENQPDSIRAAIRARGLLNRSINYVTKHQ